MIRRPTRPRVRPARRSGGCLRLAVALVIAAIAIISFLGSRVYNPVTGEEQYLSLTTHQEIALGLQAAPQMIAQYGGLYPDEELQDYIDEVGSRIVRSSAAADTPWEFEFHLLNDPQTVNAFALPGGQVFITTGLYGRFETEGQLVGVLGHEIGHVVARHSAQRIAKSELTQGLVGAVVVASGEAEAGQVAAVVGELVNMKYGREDELQSDELGVWLMSDAGYDPRAMIEVMQILEAASSGAGLPEFFSTHPNPENRIENIQAAIQERFPDGVPEGLTP
jgi:predicted Zn-dependent protease